MYSTQRVIRREVEGQVLQREALPRKGGGKKKEPRERRELAENNLAAETQRRGENRTTAIFL